MNQGIGRPIHVRYSRILPIVCIMYLIAFLDRNNIGFGFGPMQKTLHFSPTVSGLAGGIFFLGGLISQIPGGYLASRYSAKKTMIYSMLAWGILAVATGFVNSVNQLLLFRFLLGLAEGAVLPSTLMMIANWFPLSERGRANSYWAIALPISGIIMGPLSGLILAGLSWRWLFILEGIPALIWAVVTLLMTDDSPQNSKFVSEYEKSYLQEEFAKDVEEHPPVSVSTNWKGVFLSTPVWIMAIAGFLFDAGYYGYALWLPTVIKSLTHTGFVAVGLLAALPNVAAVIGQYLNGRHSDRTGERKYHVVIPFIGGGVVLLLSVLTVNTPLISMIFLIVTLGVLWAFEGVFWAIPPLFVSKPDLGTAMGLINGVAGIGGFLGPFVFGYLVSLTHSNTAGLVFLSVALILAGMVMLPLRLKPQLSKNVVTSGVAP